jgi:hypothetical protein
MPRSVKRQWQADREAFGGRKARQGFFYETFVPDEVADIEFAIPADVAAASDATAAAVRELAAHPPNGVSWEALGRHLLRGSPAETFALRRE